MKNLNATPDSAATTLLPPAVSQMPTNNTIPSIINIPPQISTTLVWVGVGFGLGILTAWYFSRPRQRSL